MKYAPPPVSISDVSLFLFVTFAALVYINPWFCVPSTAILAAWIIDRYKTKLDLVEERELLAHAQSELRLAITKETDIKSRFDELQSQVDNLRTAQNMRFQK